MTSSHGGAILGSRTKEQIHGIQSTTSTTATIGRALEKDRCIFYEWSLSVRSRIEGTVLAGDGGKVSGGYYMASTVEADIRHSDAGDDHRSQG
jgi:hypothetical protein